MIEAFPLDWPLGFKRTPENKRKWSAFKQTPGAALDFLRDEVRRIGGKSLIISTNVPVRKDGGMYADYMAKKMDDPGVAICFEMDGDQITMCCDQYLKLVDNIYALGKSVEALRGIDRWGCSEFMKRAFTGFKALPEIVTADCWQVLNMEPTKDTAAIKKQFRDLALKNHPDQGGSENAFHAINVAYDAAMKLANSLNWHP